MKDTENFIIKKVGKSSRTLRFPDELISQLQEIATAQDLSFNQLVVQCCEYAIKHLPSEAKPEE